MPSMSVFVSHSHEDDAFCSGVVAALRGAQADVWYDEHNLGSGKLLDVIDHELRVRTVFVVILSPAALASPWVKDECSWAYNLARRDPARIILPVLAGAVAEEDIWLWLQGFKRVEAPHGQPFSLAEAIQRTLHALVLSPAGPAHTATAPTPGESVAELLARGKALQAQRRHREALPLFDRVIQLDPKAFDAWANKARAHAELDQANEALAAAERALALEPNSSVAWSAKAGALQFLGRYAEALQAADRALAIDPVDYIALTERGHALDGLGRHAEALAAYEQALALDPKYAFAFKGKGDALLSLGRKAEAKVAYEKALALLKQTLAGDPNDLITLHTMAVTLNNMGRYREALEAADKAIALNPNYGFAWGRRAYALRALGRTKEADEAAARAKELGAT